MLLLERYCGSRAQGSFGTLRLESGWECLTVERPWAGNAPFISCIPAGVYWIELGHFNAGGYPAYEIKDVVGRSEIKIHVANIASEVNGCIALGQDEGWINGNWGVTNSRATFKRFMELMDGRERDVLRIAYRDPER